MARIQFGTDGWRAIIAEDFTFPNVRACAQGVANYLKERGTAESGLVIGYDTRFDSEHFAAAVAEVLAGNGIKAYLCQHPTPTPVTSYAILTHKAAGAVVITASHNPAIWNGFKYKPEYAGSASPEVTAELERQIESVQASGKVSKLALEDGTKKGLIISFDAMPAYLQQVCRMVDVQGIRQAEIAVAADYMFGAGAGYFSALLRGGKLGLREINAKRNPLFPGIRQPEPIARDLGKLSRLVKRAFQVGLATDGDADRLGVVDENGVFITQLQVFALLALYLLEVRGQRGAIVKSITTTSMVQRLGEMYDVPVYETPVGFKYVGPTMMEHDALIGGEESGGYGYRGHIPERDGILSGLFILDFMVKLGKTPSQLVKHLYSKVGPHHYDRIDIEFPASERQRIMERVSQRKPSKIGGVDVSRMDTIDGFRFILADGSWLLIRFSGTEPLLRIYAETESPQRVQELLGEGRKIAGLS